MRSLATAFLLACATLGTQAAELSAAASEPRAYGYHVGDVVVRRVEFFVPDGLVLDEASLPRPGARGKPLELKEMSRDSSPASGGTRHGLTMTYQVFLAPVEVRTLEIAPIVLHFTGQPRDQDLRIDAWPVTVSPLVPVEASPRRGLGELQPDLAPPLIDTSPARTRLLVYAIVALLLLAYLAHVYIALPWWGSRKRPFGQAWRDVRGLPANDPAAARAALQRMHEALNVTAGEVVFENGVDRFLAAQPRYAGLRDDLVAFFQQSRREFFGAGVATAADPRWLQQFSRRCRDAERGAA
jgi:mxaA protein